MVIDMFDKKGKFINVMFFLEFLKDVKYSVCNGCITPDPNHFTFSYNR